MWTVTHVATALLICSFLGSKVSRRDKILFVLGSLLPDLDHIYEPYHRYLFHNIFFLIFIIIIFRSWAITSGVILHFSEDFLASDLNTLLYPVAVVDIGFKWSWLYSAQFNILIGIIYLITLIFKEDLLRNKDIYTCLRLFLAIIGILSFGIPKISELLFSIKDLMIIQIARFLGSTILILSYFPPNLKTIKKFLLKRSETKS